MENLFKGIYKDYDNYKAIVAKVLGRDNPYIEDIISNCILKIVEYINQDRLTIEQITYKNTQGINASFFKTTLVRMAIDFKKSKQVRDTVILDKEIIDYLIGSTEQPELNEETNTNTDYDLISFINERLDYFAKESVHHKFHQDLFKLCFYDEMNASEIQREIGISRHLVRDSKNYTTELVRKWLRENKEAIKGNQELKQKKK